VTGTLPSAAAPEAVVAALELLSSAAAEPSTAPEMVPMSPLPAAPSLLASASPRVAPRVPGLGGSMGRLNFDLLSHLTVVITLVERRPVTAAEIARILRQRGFDFELRRWHTPASHGQGPP